MTEKSLTETPTYEMTANLVIRGYTYDDSEQYGYVRPVARGYQLCATKKDNNPLQEHHNKIFTTQREIDNLLAELS